MHTTQQLNLALDGRYRIERHIGEGGMATVYLARDAKHQRLVALKVLKPDLGAVLGVERFLSEIQVTANLQHPNLLPLFDSGAVDNLLFYVMPYIEGESLRARLEREKQLPIDEAVRMAVAISGALDYAHRRGVIHRDLKPENILLHEGQPLLADFGIALAVSNAGGNRITQTGLSLGTPQYMSPEQATGDRVIDNRTDIYSLGAVTYEMLTGEPPHTGATSQAIIARLLTERPRSIRASRPNVSENVEGAIERALEKIPADRWETAKEFGEALTGTRIVTRSSRALTTEYLPQSSAAERVATATVVSRSRPALREMAAWVVGAAGIALFATGIMRRTAPPSRGVASEFVVELPDSLELSSFGGQATIAISRDGSTIVFQAERAGEPPRLFRRDLDDRTVVELRGTDSASSPSLSANGSEIVFQYSSSGVRRVPLRGGNPRTFTDSGQRNQPVALGDAAHAVIIFRNRLHLAPAEGGAITLLAEPDTLLGHRSYGFPDQLPGGRAALLAISRNRQGVGNFSDSVTLGVVSIPDGKVSDLRIAGTSPKYSDTGHIVFATPDGMLMAVPFDVAKRRVTGAAFVVVEGVRTGAGGAAAFAVARGGIIAYVAGTATDISRELVAVSRNAVVRSLGLPYGYYSRPRVSPNGKELAVEIGTRGIQVVNAADPDIWRIDLTSKTRIRLTTDSSSSRPSWSPDGEYVAYSLRGTDSLILRRNIRDPRRVDTLVRDPRVGAMYYGIRGGYVAIPARPETLVGPSDIWIAHTDSLEKPRVLVAEPYAEYSPVISPDGKLVAYVSYRSGVDEVHVRPISGASDDVKVSVSGGQEPVWSRETRELFYRTRADTFMSAQIEERPQLTVTRRTALFADTLLRGTPTRGTSFDVFPGAQEFLMMRRVSAADSLERKLIVLQNWHLKAKQAVRGDGG